MKRGFMFLPLIALAAFSDAPKKTVFSGLKVGQSVGLKDHGTTFEINVMDDAILQSHKVIEIGDNFIVLEDVANVTQTTIPVYSVKAIVRWKTK